MYVASYVKLVVNSTKILKKSFELQKETRNSWGGPRLNIRLKILSILTVEFEKYLLAKPKNKDHVLYLSSLASKLFSEFFQVPEPI